MSDIQRLRRLVAEGYYSLTRHALVELVDDDFSRLDLLAAFGNAVLLEDYADAKRGPCCLLYGIAQDGTPMHIVATTGGESVIVITVYRPTPPKWVTPTKRGRQP